MVCDPLWPSVARQLKRCGNFDEVENLVVAVSGGPDSVVLLHLLKTEACPRFRKLSLHVAHLNHGLRGATADEDADFVSQWCSRWNLPCVIERIDVQVYAQAEKKNWESKARELRYDFLGRVAAAAGSDTMATGHTMTDQAETVLLRLLRGAGPGGLAGILPLRHVNFRSSEIKEVAPVRVIRPLLGVTRREVEQYLERHHLTARQDQTNDDFRYSRNRLRGQVWPLLESFNPRLVEVLARTAEQAQADAQYFLELTTQWLNEHARTTTEGVWLPAAELAELHTAVQGRILHAVAQQGNFPAVSAYHIHQLAGVLLSTGSQGKRVILPGGRRVRRSGNFLLFERAKPLENDR